MSIQKRGLIRMWQKVEMIDLNPLFATMYKYDRTRQKQ